MPRAFAASAISSIVALPSADQVVCACRSPRRSLSSTSAGSSPRRAASSSPAASRSSGGTNWYPSHSYSSSSVVNVRTSPDSTSVIPYSEIENPRRWASSRIATLWLFEPVKCWSRLP